MEDPAFARELDGVSTALDATTTEIQNGDSQLKKTKRQMTRAQKLWEHLRNHVNRGFFNHLLNQDVRRTVDAFSAISNIWSEVLKFGKIKASATDTGKAHSGTSVHQPNVTDDSFSQTFDPRLGLIGLSLDSVPNINIGKALRDIAKGLCTRVEEADFYAAQLQYTRGWKLLLLGLTQAESVARYFAMMSLRKVIRFINETLLDQILRDNLIKALLNIMISDERKENRLKAVYLLGELGFFLGAVREHDALLMMMFRELAKRLLEIQTKEKLLQIKGESTYFTAEQRALKISLFHAIGKFTSSTNKYSGQIEDLAIYLMHEEFAKGEAHLQERSDVNPGGIYLVKALLDIMNSQIRQTEYNRTFIGALFKKFVHPLMKNKSASVQMEAVHFVSNWLPVQSEEALLTGLEVLVNGLEASKDIGFSNFDRDLYGKERKELNKRQKQESARLAMRSKLLRQMVQVPGTYAKLEPVKDYPGFFADVNSSLLNSRGCVVQLPIHAKSLVTITRLLPGIPGVPSNVTTVPPVFMDPAWAEKQTPPTSRYQWLEKAGKVHGLPVGYVRGPGTVVETKALGKDDGELKGDRVKSAKTLTTINVPEGMTKAPPRVDAIDARRVPAGFSTNCPFPGIDLERIDRHNRPSSAIYGAAISRSGAQVSSISPDCPEGYTFDKHPVLWPSKQPNLRTAYDISDFPVNAPVLFDIIQPSTQTLQRILCKVASINKMLTAVSVQGDAENVALAVGTLLNVYVQSGNSSEWSTVNLEVTDDDYVDDMTFGQKRLAKGFSGSTTSLSSQGSAIVAGANMGQLPEPVASGFSSNGEPYFAPPVNFPPIPAGYTAQGLPYFGKSASIKPLPVAITGRGERLYTALDGSKKSSGVSSQVAPPNMLAGYDNKGHPFFLPRGCTLPMPSGLTQDGIAFYDIPSLMHQRGIMVRPAKANEADFPAEELELDESATDPDETVDGTLVRKKMVPMADVETEVTTLVESLMRQSHLDPGLGRPKGAPGNKIRRLAFATAEASGFEQGKEDEEPLTDPTDIVAFFRESEDLVSWKSVPMKIAVEPTSIEFRSVNAKVTKVALLRYRAGRGDHGERDLFVSVNPVGVFEVNSFHFRLQGEGVIEIQITYHPTSLKTDRAEGAMNIIDDEGKKLAVCGLLAIRQSFVKITPTHIDAGWVLPGKKKECSYRIENISSGLIAVDIVQESEVLTAQASGRSTPPRKSPFIAPARQIKLQSSEARTMAVIFEPSYLGHFSDLIELYTPGGDVLKVTLSGVSGIPVAIFPEDEESSAAGAAALTRERCDFMNKFRRVENATEKVHIPLTDKGTAILRNIMSATSDQESRKEVHTMDFGIIMPNETVMRCLTLMNLSDAPVTVGLYPHSSTFQCPYMIRIAPRMANSIEIKFAPQELVKGNVSSLIEIVCPEFQNIMLIVKAYVGQPIYFLSWDFAFFRPCRIGQQDTINMVLVNDAQCPLSVVTANLVEGVTDENNVSSSLSLNPQTPTVVPACSVIPVSFRFTARERGPYLRSVSLKVISPFVREFPGGVNSRPFYLAAICIEPYQKDKGAPDKNSIDFMRMWMSHPKRLTDEFPSREEVEKRFDLTPIKPATAYPSCTGVEFRQDPLTFRAPTSLKSAGVQQATTEASIRKSQVVNTTINNKSKDHLLTIFFASTCFSVDPRQKVVQGGEAENIDVMYIPPPDAWDMVTSYGFAVALFDKDHTMASMRLIGKQRPDFLVYPAVPRGQDIIMDFGCVETTAQKSETSALNLTFFNLNPTSYSWTIKFVNSKTKFMPFEASMFFGELGSMESYVLPLRFHSDTSGTFEALAEIYVRETLDRNAQASKIASVILRGVTVFTSVVGFPEAMDFGSTAVFHNKRKRFMLQNGGTTDAVVTLLVRAPFQVAPKSFRIAPSESQEITVVYSPTESRTTQVKMLIFMNHKLQIVPLSGTGGLAELLCEKYDKKDVDFGIQREGTVAWLDCYLTNKGSLPLTLTAITSNVPDLVRVEYVNVTSSIPHESERKHQANRDLEEVTIRKDHWGTVKRKMRIIVILRMMANKSNGKQKRSSVRKNNSFQQQQGTSVKILRTGNDISGLISGSLPKDAVPSLKPFHSYHVRIGFTNKYQTKKATELRIYYLPVTADEEESELPSLLKYMEMNLAGSVYRVLEFVPPFHDFGLVPAEAYLQQDVKTQDVLQTYGVLREDSSETSSSLHLQVINMGFEVQNLTLKSITPPFTITARTWCLQSGDKIIIPGDFHPPQEQVQYRGEAVFVHKYGTTIIALSGTGASADITCDSEIDFGTVKLQAVTTKQLLISNRGLLEGKFSVQLLQQAAEFRFSSSDEPHDFEGYIESGSTKSIDINCCCQNATVGPAKILLRWQRVPRGKWEDVTVPLQVCIGQPVFKLPVIEVDFAVTYMTVSKTITLTVTNDGNAPCQWSGESENERGITISPTEGVLGVGSQTVLNIIFDPQDYTPISSLIRFTTDAGPKSLMCYGIVGVPYLTVLDADKTVDFGIIEINKSHTHEINLSNTGAKPIEFTIGIESCESDGIEISVDDCDVYFISPSQQIVAPHESAKVTFTAFPVEYNAVVKATFVVRTKDGERIVGKISCVGGKAIVKIGRPTAPASSDVSATTRSASVVTRAAPLESTRLALTSHLETLQEVLAGLRSAELDNFAETQVAEYKSGISRAQTPVGSGPRSAPRTPSAKSGFHDGSDHRTGERQQFVTELDERILNLTDDVATVEDQMRLRAKGPRHTPPQVTTYRPGSARPTSSSAIFITPVTPVSAGSSRRSGTPTSGRLLTPDGLLPGAQEDKSDGLLKRPLSGAQVAEVEGLQPSSLAPGTPGTPGGRPISAQLAALQGLKDDEFLQRANEAMLEKTHIIIRAVKEKLSNTKSKNREFLTSALRKLQESAGTMETITRDSGGEQEESVFSLGLVRGGDKLPAMLLFNLPNMGNLPFDFVIVPRAGSDLRPLEYNPNERDNELFAVEPNNGTIAPTESVNISATFQARLSGQYQEGYELKSNGLTVVAFTITVTVGNAQMTVSPPVCDFGLLRKNTSSSRTIIISNIGTYRDTFRIEPYIANALREDMGMAEQPAFAFSLTKGELEPKQEFPISVVFTPPNEGLFANKFKILWSKEPLVLEARGEGGGSKLRMDYRNAEDVAFSGLDWGVCVVGTTYEKVFDLKNVGNCAAECTISHNNDALRFDVRTNEDGYINVRPGSAVEIKVQLTPSAPSKIHDPIQIRLSEGHIVAVPLRALCGTCRYEIEGSLNFANMPIDSLQSKQIKFINTGDLEIPFSASIEPEEMREWLSCVVSKFNNPLEPNAAITIDVSAAPKKDAQVTGNLVITTSVGKGPVTSDIPFSFRAYGDQLAMDDTQEASVGRVNVGDVASIERTLTNWGTTPVEYRVRIELVEKSQLDGGESTTPQPSSVPKTPKSGKSTPKITKAPKSPKTPGSKAGTTKSSKGEKKTSGEALPIAWKLGSAPAGVIQPGETVTITALYNALAAVGESWQEAKLIVEKIEDGHPGKWVAMTSIPMKGATGVPVLALHPSEIDFGYSALNHSAETPIEIANEGSAPLLYEFMSGYAHEDIITFDVTPGLTGMVEPGNKIVLTLRFLPTVLGEYESVINLTTNIEKRAIVVRGRGSMFKLKEDRFPKILALGPTYIGETNEKKFEIFNDCTCPIPIELSVTGELDETEQETQVPSMEHFQLVPNKFEMAPNETDYIITESQRTVSPVVIKLTPPVPYMNMANRDAVDMPRLIEMLSTYPRRHFIKLISSALQAPYRFPVTHQLSVHAFQACYLRAADPQRRGAAISNEDLIPSIDFGEVAMSIGSDYSLALHNPNGFKLPFEVTISEPQFMTQTATGTISGKGFRDLSFLMKPFEIPDGEDVPPFLTFAGTVKVSLGVSELEELNLEIKGTLIDEAEADFATSVDFGDRFCNSTSTVTYHIRNPFRRGIDYTFAMDSMETGFTIIGGEGTLGPRESKGVSVTFSPTDGMKHTATAVLTTEDIKTLVEIEGTGVFPVVTLKPDTLDFGVVGIEDPEIRDIRITNESSLPMEIALNTTSDMFSLLNASNISLESAETQTIQIVFKPKTKLEQMGQLEIRRVESATMVALYSVIGSCSLKGSGGMFAMSSTAGGPLQVIRFPQIPENTRSKQTFMIENLGDTDITVGLTDRDGVNFADNVEITPGGSEALVSYHVSPATAVIRPKSRQQFTVTVTGLQEGQTEFEVQVRTSRLLVPKSVPIVINATVTPGKKMDKSILTFVRADHTIDSMILAEAQEDYKFDSEEDLWRLLFPIVRVRAMLPSMDRTYIPMVEPNLSNVDIRPFTIRPPALPTEPPVNAQRKWYQNRVSLKLDGPKHTAAMAEKQKICSEAIDFVKGMEKVVVLERKRQ